MELMVVIAPLLIITIIGMLSIWRERSLVRRGQNLQQYGTPYVPMSVLLYGMLRRLLQLILVALVVVIVLAIQNLRTEVVVKPASTHEAVNMPPLGENPATPLRH